MKTYISIISLIIFSIATVNARTLISNSEYRNIYSEDYTLEIEILKVGTTFNVLDEGGAAAIIEFDYFGYKWYEVVSHVLTAAIPPTARGICIATTRAPHLCNAVYSISSSLVNMYENQIRDGIETGLQWIAKKFSGTSCGNLIVDDYEDAMKAKQVFNYYEQTSCFPWQRPQEIIHSTAVTVSNSYSPGGNVRSTLPNRTNYVDNKPSRNDLNDNLIPTPTEYGQEDARSTLSDRTNYANNQPYAYDLNGNFISNPNEHGQTELIQKIESDFAKLLPNSTIKITPYIRSNYEPNNMILIFLEIDGITFEASTMEIELRYYTLTIRGSQGSVSFKPFNNYNEYLHYLALSLGSLKTLDLQY